MIPCCCYQNEEPIYTPSNNPQEAEHNREARTCLESESLGIRVVCHGDIINQSPVLTCEKRKVKRRSQMVLQVPVITPTLRRLLSGKRGIKLSLGIRSFNNNFLCGSRLVTIIFTCSQWNGKYEFGSTHFSRSLFFAIKFTLTLTLGLIGHQVIKLRLLRFN